MKFYEPESRYWKIIESLGYKEGKLNDYSPDTVKSALVRLYSPKDVRGLRAFINDAYKNLYNVLDGIEHEELCEIVGNYISDDGFSDLLHDIIGAGRDFYHDVINNPKEALKGYDYRESFSYYVPYDSEITSHREYAKWGAISAWDEDLYALIGILTVLKNSDKFPSLDAKYATGSLIESFISLFTEIIEDEYSERIANFFNDFTKDDYSHLAKAFDGYWVPNIINDLKKVHFSELPEFERV